MKYLLAILVLLSAGAASQLLCSRCFRAPPLEDLRASNLRQKFLPRDTTHSHELYARLKPGVMRASSNRMVCTGVSRATPAVAVGSCSLRLDEVHHCYGGGEATSACYLVVERDGEQLKILSKYLGTPHATTFYTARQGQTLANWLPPQATSALPPALPPERFYALLGDFWSGQPVDDELTSAMAALILSSIAR